MTNPTDLMNQYLSLYGVSQDSVRGSKQRDLAAASANKRGEIAQITAPEAAFDELAGRQADQGYDSANQTQRDFRDLSPVELEFKYGSQASGLIEARVNAASRLAQSQNNQRTTGELVGDSALAVARGGASMLGLGALGVNLGAKAVGADNAAQIGLEAARFSQSVTDFLNDRQSDTLKAEKNVTEAKIRQANRDSDKRYAEDVKAGDSMAKANQIISEFRNVGKQILENPTVLADSVAEGLGSMGGAGVLAKGVAKVGGAVAARLAPGVQLSEKAAGRLAAANMAGSIGAQEGGSAFQGTTLEAYDILSRDYPEMSEQQKAMLATQAGEMAAATQAPVAAVTGLLVARFEMNPLKAPASAFGVNTIEVEQARAKGAVAAASKKDSSPPKDYTSEQRLAWFEGREEARQLAAAEAAQEAAEAEIEAPIVEDMTETVMSDPEPVVEAVAEEAPVEAQESPEPVSQPAETQEAEIVPDEAPVTAEQVSEIVADALEANNEAQKPEPVVEPVPTITEVEASPETLKTRFPNLVGHTKGSKITNWFSKAFKLVEDNGVRLWSYEGNPVRSMLDMLTGDAAGYLGRNGSGDRLTPQVVSAYEEFVEGNATKLIRSLNRRVDAFLNAPHSKENKTPRKELFRSGEQAYNEFETGRILNLTEFEDGKFKLNQELVGFATLAALQWTQQLNNFGSEKDVDDVASLLGIEEAGSNIKQLISGKHREIADAFNTGLTTLEASRSLAGMIKKYWGYAPSKDAPLVELEDGSYELSFDRGITKNPLTVTLYGSGEKGIAEKLTDVLAEKIHERMTALLQTKAASPETSTADAMFPNDPNAELNFEQFKASYEALTGTELKSAKTVSLTGVARERMVQHMLDLLVLPMQDAIKSTVGPELMDTLTDIRQSTQIQSIAIAYAFRAKVEAAMAAKGNRKSEYLSQAELDQIFESLAPLFPVLQTNAQNFYIPKSNKADDQAANFSQTLSGTMSTPAFTQAPSNSGVRGIPSLVIGSGDGMMMQNHSASSEGPGKTLDVFDGLNLPIDMIEDYSSRINQAVANAWQANPLQGVADAFTGFLPNYDLQGKSREEVQEIRTALFGFDATAKSHPVSMIATGLKTLQETLQRKAQEVKARQNALARVSFKVDQMAGAASPYQTQGDISLEGLTTEQIAQELNKLYEEELAKLNGVSVTEAADVSSIKAMAAKLKAEGWQTDILSDQLQSLAEQGYQIVTGSIEQLRAFLNDRGVNPNVLDRSSEGRSVNGLTMPDKKLIVLVNPSAETLVHEAIHGATFETVAAYYDGRDLGPRAVEKARAVERIEQLMAQLVALGVSGETEAAQQAVFDVVSVVDPLLAQGKKAEALNEFMAWSLSNQDLAQTLSKTKASSLVQLARNVIDGIKRLMFGGKKSPVLDDMFTNLRFNTKILAAPVESPLSLFDDTVLYHSPAYGMSQRLVRLNEALRSTVAVHFQNQMRDNSPGEIQNARNKIAELSAMSGQSVVAANLGFSMNAQESTTYQMLTSVMASAVALDANALSKAADIFTHVSKNLTVADFRQNPDVDDIADATHANEKFNFVMGNYAKEFDALDRSSLLPNFVALALVSEEFRSILAKMPLPADVRNTDGTLDARLENAGMNVMDWLGRKLAGQKSTDRNIAAVMDSLAEQIIKTASERQSFISVVAGHVGGAIDTVNSTVANFMEATAEKGMQLGTKVKNSPNRKTVRVAGEAINAVSGVLNRRVGNENAENLIAETFRTDLPKAFTDLVNDLVGRTESNAPIYDLIKRVRSWVTQSRQQYREHLPQKIAEQFSRELSEQEWADMHSGIGKTDLAALRFKYTMADLTDILAQPSRVSAEISKLEGDLKTAHPQDFPTLQRKALQLANYMNTGVPGSTLLRNAAAIADLLGENRSKGYAPTKDTEQMLDALVSLYALDMLPQTTKDSLAKLASSEASGISFTVEYLAALRKFELRRANGNARFNHFKGYIPNEKKEEATLVVAKDEDYVGLRQQSFKRIANYGGSNLERNMSNRGYYLVPVSTRANYQQGIMQTVQQTVGGVDLMSGLSHDRSAAGVINDANAVRRAWMNRGRESGSELLMPLFDENGNIMAYERSVDPAIMARVQKDNHLGKAMGQWRGRQVEEREGQYVNRMLIERMADMFNKASADEQQNLFVDLFDHKVRKKDPVLEDVYKSLPGHVVQDIVSVFGTRFPVRKDMLNDAMGYRDASVRDLWSSNSRWKPEVVETAKNVIIGTMGMDAYRKLVSAEKLIQNVMTDLRVIIVVKSMFVPAANLTWNVFQLASRGVPLGSIGKGIPRKVAEVNDYLKRREREIDAEAELKAAGADVRKTRTLEAELQSLRDSYKRLSIWPLIEAGEFTSISDGILSQDDLKLSEGRLSEYIEGLANKLPPAARTMARYGLVARDTALFKGLQRTVEYGDFLSKAILYDDLVGRQKKTPEEALAMITEEFVNYDRLPGRSRGYLEQMGLMWFWHFKIRSTKVALSMVRNNPVHAMLAMSMPVPDMFGAVGSPLTDNMLSVLAEGRAGFSIGPDMALRAPLLHPLASVI